MMRLVAPVRGVVRFSATVRPITGRVPIARTHCVAPSREPAAPYHVAHLGFPASCRATGSGAGQHSIAPLRLASPYRHIPVLSCRAPQRRMFSSSDDKNADTQETELDEKVDMSKVVTTIVGLGALGFLTARVLLPRFGLLGVLAGYSVAIALAVAVRSLSVLQGLLLFFMPPGCVVANMQYQQAKKRDALRELGVAEEDMGNANIWREFENNRVRIIAPDKRRVLAYRSFFLQRWKLRFEDIHEA